MMAIASHVPTRCGTLMFVLEDIVASKEAIWDMCTCDDWEEASKDSKNATIFHRATIGYNTSFWRHASVVLSLLRLVMDYIHQIEVDLPRLSQAMPLYNKLRNHFAVW